MTCPAPQIASCQVVVGQVVLSVKLLYGLAAQSASARLLPWLPSLKQVKRRVVQGFQLGMMLSSEPG